MHTHYCLLSVYPSIPHVIVYYNFLCPSTVNIVAHTDFSVLPTHGPCSKYNITDTATGSSYDGRVTIEFQPDPYRVRLTSRWFYMYNCIRSVLTLSIGYCLQPGLSWVQVSASSNTGSDREKWTSFCLWWSTTCQRSARCRIWCSSQLFASYLQFHSPSPIYSLRCVAMVTVMCIMETTSTAACQPCRMPWESSASCWIISTSDIQ